MTKRKTPLKSSWGKRIAIITFAIGAILFLSPFLPGLQNNQQPLADPVSLKRLEEGQTLPVPPDELWGEFLGKKIATIPTFYDTPTGILGQTVGNKKIEVDLTNQKVYAFEGNTKVYEFVVSTGKWSPTPTGTFKIWSKVRSQKMSGGSKALRTYYYLPNVPHVMFYYNDQTPKHKGYSLHGAYWHNNFGHPMSHGCINMKLEDAKTLYEWATPVVTNPKAWSTLATDDNPGTTVLVYGETPRE